MCLRATQYLMCILLYCCSYLGHAFKELFQINVVLGVVNAAFWPPLLGLRDSLVFHLQRQGLIHPSADLFNVSYCGIPPL